MPEPSSTRNAPPLRRTAERVRRRLGRAPRDERRRGPLIASDARARERLGDVERDVRRVGDAPGACRGSAAPPRAESATPSAFVEPAQLLIDLDLAHDLRAGRDVADLLREEARALLLEERRGLPVREGLLEALARALLLVDRAFDRALADAEAEAAHRRVRGERKRVGYTERDAALVREALLEHDAGDAGARVDNEARRP